MVGVIRTAAAPPGTTAAGFSAPGLEVCGWGNAMVAFWRGQIAGNMDMGVPRYASYYSRQQDTHTLEYYMLQRKG